MTKLTAAEWRNFWFYYADEEHQQAAVQMLYEQMPESLLQDDSAWVVQYRTKPPEPEMKTLTPDAPFSAKITPHVTYGEIALQSEARRFRTQAQCDVCTELCEFMETARAHFGGHIIVTSGYRPEPINSQVGGSSTSEHLYDAPDKGAVDWFLDGVSTYELQDWCLAQWPYSTGKGAPKGFIHTGMRTGRPNVVWNYAWLVLLLPVLLAVTC